MLTPSVSPYRKRYPSSKKTFAPVPPAALVLAACTYNRAAQLNWIELTFDRDIDISAISVAAFYVNDDDSDEAYTGSGTATLVAPQAVRIPMMILHGSSGPGTELTVGDDSGIVAADDGGTWAGVSELALPFG